MSTNIYKMDYLTDKLKSQRNLPVDIERHFLLSEKCIKNLRFLLQKYLETCEQGKLFSETIFSKSKFLYQLKKVRNNSQNHCFS